MKPSLKLIMKKFFFEDFFVNSPLLMSASERNFLPKKKNKRKLSMVDDA